MWNNAIFQYEYKIVSIYTQREKGEFIYKPSLKYKPTNYFQPITIFIFSIIFNQIEEYVSQFIMGRIKWENNQFDYE